MHSTINIRRRPTRVNKRVKKIIKGPHYVGFELREGFGSSKNKVKIKGSD